MKYVIALIILACLSTQTFAQSYDLRFELVQNNQYNGGIYSVKVQIKKTFPSSFKMGSSNIRFNYNSEALMLATNGSLTPLNFHSGDYNVMTTTGSNTGIVSINIDLVNPNTGSPVITNNDWMDIAIVEFIIIDRYQTSQLEFRTSSPGKNIVFKDDQQTIMEHGQFTGLNSRLSNKLKPIFASKQNSNFELYPNPAVDQVTIRIPEWEHTKGAVCMIYNLQGKMLARQQVNQSETSIDLSTLVDGTYLISLFEDGDFMAADQLVIVR